MRWAVGVPVSEPPALFFDFRPASGLVDLLDFSMLEQALAAACGALCFEAVLILNLLMLMELIWLPRLT